MPTWTVALVTSVEPVAPEIVTEPAAVSVQSVGSAVPPKAFSTVLMSVSSGAIGVLTMVQVAASPTATVTLVAVEAPAPVHDQSDAVYPVGPDSERS